MQKEPCLDIDLEDNELVTRIVETNNTELFGVLYDRHAPKVYNKCLGLLKNPIEAQDLTHDIFVHLFVKLRTFKGRSEERRVGKECRSRWSEEHEKKKR